MRPRVTLVAAGAVTDRAVGGRIDAFARGLAGRGWDVTVVDPPVPPTDLVDHVLMHTPTVLRSVLENAGVEGDLRPGTGWRAHPALRGVTADVVVVSMPPFSLLGAAAVTLDPRVPLVVDYRDPWSARRHPPPLARATRAIERRAVRRAAAVTYAGGAALGDLLVQHLRLPPHRVISVPHGFDPLPRCSAALCETAPPYAPEYSAPDPAASRASQRSTPCSTASYSNLDREPDRCAQPVSSRPTHHEALGIDDIK